VELVIAISVLAVLAAATPQLMAQGLRAFLYLPKAELTQQVADEALSALVEGSSSAVNGQRIPGLRYAVPGDGLRAVWYAAIDRLAYRTPDAQLILIYRQGERLRRSVLTSAVCGPSGPAPNPANDEALPYFGGSTAQVRIMPTDSGPIFQYLDPNGTVIAAAECDGVAPMLRVSIALVAQTGNGSFEHGDARFEVRSSAAIRFQ